MGKDIKSEQIEATINENNEMGVFEHRTIREQHMYRDEILDRIKAVLLLGSSTEITVEMAAEYYMVPVDTIKTVIKRNRNEFNDYAEIRVLKGKSLKEFCQVHDEPRKLISPKVRSLQIVNRRGLLRLGMLLTESEVGKSIRHYLLNVEEATPKQIAIWAAQREIARTERKQLTDAIKEFYEGNMKDSHAYTNFTQLVYMVCFDKNKKGLMEVYDLDEKDQLRDAMTTEDLRKVVQAEKAISVLVQLGKDYAEIKDELLKNKHKFQ